MRAPFELFTFRTNLVVDLVYALLVNSDVGKSTYLSTYLDRYLPLLLLLLLISIIQKRSNRSKGDFLSDPISL